ncbi:hypothetical protein RJ640_007350, partial [Escallonia rubra]
FLIALTLRERWQQEEEEEEKKKSFTFGTTWGTRASSELEFGRTGSGTDNSNYKNDTMIRKEVFLTPAALRECRRIISDSEIMREDDKNWPEPDRVGRQELEIVMGNEHISFTTSKIGSLMDVQTSADPEGLRIFYYLVQVGDVILFVFFVLLFMMFL